MFTTLTILAGRGGGGAGLNTDGITDWLASNVVPILLAVIGIAIIASARKGRISDSFNTIAIVMVGIVMLLGAAAFMRFGNNLTGVIFN